MFLCINIYIEKNIIFYSCNLSYFPFPILAYFRCVLLEAFEINLQQQYFMLQFYVGRATIFRKMTGLKLFSGFFTTHDAEQKTILVAVHYAYEETGRQKPPAVSYIHPHFLSS